MILLFFVFISFSIEKQCCDRLCLSAICYDDDDDGDIHIVLAVASTTVVCFNFFFFLRLLYFIACYLLMYRANRQ